jgi:uncharacterized protein (TIRG00374 family)
MKNIKKFEREIILALVLGIVVSSLLMFWGDLEETFEQILSFNWLLLAPIILLLTCSNYFLRLIRWHLFLKKVGFKNKLSFRNSALIFLSGLPLTLTPGKSGEVLKAYFLKRVMGDHLSRTIPIVITERLTDGLGALVLLSFGFYSYPFGWAVLLFAFVSCGLFIFLIYHDRFWDVVLRWLKKLGNKRDIFKKAEEKLVGFRKVFLELVSLRSLLVATGLATLAWLAEAIGFSIIVADVIHQPLTLEIISKSIFIFCFVSILGFASLLPGGLGVAEGGFAGMLILLLELTRSQAVAATILLRLLTLWWGVAIGLVAFSLVLRRFKYSDG